MSYPGPLLDMRERVYCSIDNALEAPTTLVPSYKPTSSYLTLSPSDSPTTLAPTYFPTTSPVTLSPISASPTTSPVTLSPSNSPTSLSPSVSPFGEDEFCLSEAACHEQSVSMGLHFYCGHYETKVRAHAFYS